VPVRNQGDQVAEGFVEHSFRRSTLLPWLMTDEQRKHLMPGPRRVVAAAVLVVVLVVVVFVAAHHWAAGPVTGAERTACATAKADPPRPADGHLVVSPTLVRDLRGSHDNALAAQAVVLGDADQLPTATVQAAYQRVLDTCAHLGVPAG